MLTGKGRPSTDRPDGQRPPSVIQRAMGLQSGRSAPLNSPAFQGRPTRLAWRCADRAAAGRHPLGRAKLRTEGTGLLPCEKLRERGGRSLGQRLRTSGRAREVRPHRLVRQSVGEAATGSSNPETSDWHDGEYHALNGGHAGPDTLDPLPRGDVPAGKVSAPDLRCLHR